MTVFHSEIKWKYTPVETAIWILGILGLVFSLYATSVGFNNTLFDFHGFRQTQTAISTESLLHGGPFFRYETPVLGPPWSLPFEFPLYEGMVAAVARIFSTPLDPTGRFVSIFLYYLCFFPLISILRDIGLRGVQAIPALTLFAVSPLYVFVSRLFMIESTALLFALLYTAQMFRLTLGEERWRYRHIVAATVFGVLAGLVKVTTFAPFFVLGACLVIWRLHQGRKRGEVKTRVAAAAFLFCMGLPVIATWAWTKFADAVKVQNPIGIFLTSKNLSAWNFGTFDQRLHPRVYLQLLGAADNHIGSIWVGAFILAVYLWMCRRSNPIVIGCVALYVGTIMLFFNLHVVHEYYPYSNALFLVVAIGVLISSILKIPGPRAWIGVALLVLAMGACGFRYFTHFYPIQRNNAAGRPEAAALIDETTAPQSVILILGLDWSAELPYQSHRRAIMDPPFNATFYVRDVGPVAQAIANEGVQNISALVACGQGRYRSHLQILLQVVGMPGSTDLHGDDCDIYKR